VGDRGGGGALGSTGSVQTVQEAERQLIVQALKETGGNRTLAAQRIGVSRRTLHRKLHEYKLEDL
jgi:two-component system, NtrC family, response regulator AtoC